MIYLFKCRTNSDDVFYHLYRQLKKEGHECLRIIDERCSNVLEVVKSLKNKDVKLISSDHLHISPKDSLSVLEMAEEIKPVAMYYGIHDLAINDIGLDSSNIDYRFILLLPGEPWNTMYSGTKAKIYNVGYPRFIELPNHENQILFAASLIYIYEQRPPSSFKNDFQWVIKHGIPIKFPSCPAARKLIKRLNIGNTLNLDLETHRLLGQYKVVISNSASSICVESAMNGCVSINLGAGIGSRYDMFNVHHMTVKDLNKMNKQDVLKLTGNKVHKEYMFNISKTIKVLTR